jgi:hypothetical protein
MAALLIIATIILVIYTRNRTRDLPADEKKLGRPLYLSAVAVFLLGIASFVNYLINFGYWPVDPLQTYFQLSNIAPGILTIAGLMILGWERYNFVPIIMMIITALVGFLFPVMGVAMSPMIFIGIFNLALYILPIGLFGYLSIKQRRLTSFSLFMIVLTYLIFPITGVVTDPIILGLLLLLRFIGPGMAIVVFHKTDIGFTLELGGYTAAILSLAIFLTYFQDSPIFLAMTDIDLIVTVILISISAALGVISGTYTLGRWRKSRNLSTFTLASYLFIAGIAFLLVALNNIGFFGYAIEWEYIVMILSIVVLIPLNVSAFLALDWRRGLLIPFIIAIPPVLLLLMNYPTHPDDIAIRNILMAFTGILQNVIPFVLYITLWWRMRKANASGRSRALFLAIGIILLLVAAAGGNLLTPMGSILLLIAFVGWLLAVTGYADKLLKTAGE